MTELTHFTLTFLNNHPGNAAKILEQLPPQDTAALLETLPTALAARILEKTTSYYGGQCLTHLKLEVASRLLEESRAVTGASLLRMMPLGNIKNLLNQLSEKKNRILKSRLSYPRDLTGAWMDMESPTLREHFSVQEARTYLRSLNVNVDHSLCVLADDGKIYGMVGLYRLAVAKNKTALKKIVSSIQNSVSDRVPLETVSALQDWENLDALPVIGPKGEYLGVLTKNMMAKGLSMLLETVSFRETDSIILHIIQGYTLAVTEMMQSILPLHQPHQRKIE